MIDSQIAINLDQFDGPLALLLHLVKKQEMEIRDLDVNKVTREYIEFLQKMQDLNFDVAGDYLLMAASLLFLKSKTAILEKDESEILGELADQETQVISREQLIERLEQLERFQKLGTKLWTLPRRGEHIFVRPKIKRSEIVNSIFTSIGHNIL